MQMPNPWVHGWTDAVPMVRQATFPRLLVALVLGVCVGAERQWRQRSAGLRTNTLVCLGAATFVDLGLTVAPNTTQVMAYVVSGVGFLGAGAIMKDGANVRGLNTAATLWCSAAVGACAGAGELVDAVFVTVLLVGVNSVLRPLSAAIDRRSLSEVRGRVLYRLRVVCAAEERAEAELEVTRAIAQVALVLRDLRVEAMEDPETALVQAVLESATRDAGLVESVTRAVKGFSWVESVDWSETEGELE